MEEDSAPATPPPAAAPSGPPELPYSLRNKKWAITFFWSLFVIDTLVQPLVLYFALWYGTDLSHNLGMYIQTKIDLRNRAWGGQL